MLDAFGHDYSLGRVCKNCGRAWTEQEIAPQFCSEKPKEQPQEELVSVPVETEDVKGLTSIIVVARMTSYPLFHYTGNCLGSIREHTNLPYEIIFIDNGSPIKLEPEKITADKIIVNEENKGVAYAWNQGIRVATGEYIVLLNNDAMVFDHWLEDFQAALDKVSLVMATPMYGTPFSRALEASQRRAIWENDPIEASFDTGHASASSDFSCVAFKQQMVRDLHQFEKENGFPTIDNGLFDEQFFAYCEDIDLLYRLKRAKMDYTYCKRVNTFHIIHATGNEQPNDAEIMNQSKEKFANKWKDQNTQS